MHFVSILIGLLCFNVATASEKRLINNLLQAYQNLGIDGRPISDLSSPLSVNFTLQLVEIYNNPDNTLDFGMLALLTWQDENLKWNPAKWGNLDLVTIPMDKIWHPDVYIFNTVFIRYASLRKDMEAVNGWLYSDGKIVWNPAVTSRVQCIRTDDSEFVYKNCTLAFGPWAHLSDKIDLNFVEGSEDWNLSGYVPQPGVEVLAHSAERVDFVFDAPVKGSHYWNLLFSIALKFPQAA